MIILAASLCAFAMLFAIRAQASAGPGGALSLAGKAMSLPVAAARAVGAQAASPAALVGTAIAVAERVSAGGGSSSAPVETPSAGGTDTPSGGGASSAPEGVAPPSSEPTSQNASPSQADPSAAHDPVSPPTAHAAVTDAIAAAAGARPVAGVQRNEKKGTPATAPERERQAEAVLLLWPSLASLSATQVAAFAPGLARFIAQFRSLARDITASSAAGGPSKLAGAAAQELALVLTGGTAPAPNAAGSGSPSALRSEASSTTLAPASGPPAVAATDGLDGAKRAAQKTSVDTPMATSPTVAGWLPSAAGAAFGSGMTGAAAPAAALLAVVVVCLLGTQLPRRLADDGLACKSALLSLRLERPG